MKGIPWIVDMQLQTGGGGYWSDQKTTVHVHGLELHEYGDGLAELRARFSRTSWDVATAGLIYTDRLWLSCLRQALQELGFSERAASAIDYSEQGMQGDDFVSLDAGREFVIAWHGLMGTTLISTD